MPAIAASRVHIVGRRFGLLPVLNLHEHSGRDRNSGELLAGPLNPMRLHKLPWCVRRPPLEVIPGTSRAGGQRNGPRPALTSPRGKSP